jgi:suppressor for copper-sensitivity B
VPAPVKLGPGRNRLSVLEVKLDEGASEPGLRLVLQAPPEGQVEDVVYSDDAQQQAARIGHR